MNETSTAPTTKLTPADIREGMRFLDLDPRLNNRTLTVTAIGDTHAITRSDSGVRRQVALDRLCMARRYRLMDPAEGYVSNG